MRRYDPNSDLDLMLITPDLEEESCDNLKVALTLAFFANRDKKEAIDPYIRRADRYPGRSSYDITDQIKPILDKYNAMLE